MPAMASAFSASPLRRDKLILVNQRTDESLAERIEVAVTRRDRRKGLLGRTGFEASSALIIAPCFSIHTMFMRFDIDAVFVSTTEHTHAFAILPALRAGKHVYSEKPLTRDVFEARQITELAATKPELMTQMGTQVHASENYRRVVELVESGAIGPVREVHCWVSRAWGWQTPCAAKDEHERVSPQ